MFTGIDRRMSRMFAADGKSLTLAFDHGNWGANTQGMADPAATLREAVAAGIDAVLTTVGQAMNFGDVISRIGLAVNMDDLVDDPTYAVDQAMAIGADMGKVIAYPGSETDAHSVQKAHRLSAICRSRSFPLMIEPIPHSFESKGHHTEEKIGMAARQAAEVGADLLKIQYTGDVETFRRVLAPLFRPAIVLGGPNRGDIRAVLTDVHGALACGAVGIAIGRNIWAHEHPAKVIAAMAVLIHGNGTVDEAMRELA